MTVQNLAWIVAMGLLVAPLVNAHTDGGLAGTPKTYCEDVKNDRYVHDYGAPSLGFVMFFAIDASIPPCPYDPRWDGHYEFAHGGAWLLACWIDCGDNGLGGGALVCWGTYADHAEFTTVTVVDNAIHTAGIPVSFSVYADQLDNVPSADPTEPPCGDFESDAGVDCVDVCAIPFGASLDGSYQVYVQGTSGHVIAGAPYVPPCSDGVDNDGDGKTDYPADPGCYSGSDNDETDSACVDGVDNDGDGRTDYPDDPGCWSPSGTAESPDPACGDGVDNDGDGLTDYPADPGCAYLRDTDETTYQCDDDVDNDGDGRTDYPDDPGCWGIYDDTESPNPACSNGLDDDGDGRTDYPTDAGCASERDGDESDQPIPRACSDGLDNDGDYYTDYPDDPGCSSASDTTENTDTPAACSDRRDNDGDLKIDYPADPDCDSPFDESEDPNPGRQACNDGIDNDGDGLWDWPMDPQCATLVDDDEAA